jgi:hypothetical protein
MKVMAKYLETTFKAYFETMELCVKGRAYWALLHVLVVLPDVCAAMERKGGDTNPDAYREWCTRFLCVSDPVMTPQDWYRLRCMLLHQGRTRDEKGQSQYEHFRFGHPPGDTPSTLHRRIETVKDGRLIHLDVLELSKDVRRAMQSGLSGSGRAHRMTSAETFKRMPKRSRKNLLSKNSCQALPHRMKRLSLIQSHLATDLRGKSAFACSPVCVS